MRRWHQEQTLMFKRWKFEMNDHGYDWRNPPMDPAACHCARGIGSMRKRTPRGHHRACLLCNYSKYLCNGERRREKYAAIREELRHM